MPFTVYFQDALKTGQSNLPIPYFLSSDSGRATTYTRAKAQGLSQAKRHFALPFPPLPLSLRVV